MNKQFTNPILPGCYPDPSICRVGRDYYLVNSTFCYFPGLPVFHSRDLVNYKLIGHALNRKTQLDLSESDCGLGIYAPTIRYHKGRFYLVCTDVGGIDNFVMVSNAPEGPWSDPYPLEDAEGIDPSLFFDDDGKCYFMATRQKHQSKRYGDNEIWIQEFCTDTLKLTGPKRVIWQGTMQNSVWCEGPHIYKKDGYYYLFTSEGGTSYEHSIMVARSKCITKPFEGCPNNPILTHRHLGKDYPIACTGHCDLVDTPKGKWYMVLLATRPIDGHYTNLGRETFLAEVDWENDWPVVNKGRGVIEEQSPFPELREYKTTEEKGIKRFDASCLDGSLIWLRQQGPHSFDKQNGYMRLFADGQFNMMCTRRTDFDFTVTSAFKPNMTSGECGIALFQNDENYLSFNSSDHILQVVMVKGGEKQILHKLDYNGSLLQVQLKVSRQKAIFLLSGHPLGEEIDISCLSPEIAGGFTGNCIGMYTNGDIGYADFVFFEYKKDTDCNTD